MIVYKTHASLFVTPIIPVVPESIRWVGRKIHKEEKPFNDLHCQDLHHESIYPHVDYANIPENLFYKVFTPDGKMETRRIIHPHYLNLILNKYPSVYDDFTCYHKMESTSGGRWSKIKKRLKLNYIKRKHIASLRSE